MPAGQAQDQGYAGGKRASASQGPQGRDPVSTQAQRCNYDVPCEPAEDSTVLPAQRALWPDYVSNERVNTAQATVIQDGTRPYQAE